MQPIIKAVLKNSTYLECGAAEVSFPIPRGEYDHVVEQLEAMRIGNAVKCDSTVERLETKYQALKILEWQRVNIDELDYLAKRLDSFDEGEMVKFQAMAAKLNVTDMQDLINLTFCCGQVTVVSDFKDLGGISPDNIELRISLLPPEFEGLNVEESTLFELNEAAGKLHDLSPTDRNKLCGVISGTSLTNIRELQTLIGNLEFFDYVPGVQTPEEYGRYMIQQSERYEYDENLEDYYDYAKYGRIRGKEEEGIFTQSGYVCYKGTGPQEELLSNGYDQKLHMGGLS